MKNLLLSELVHLHQRNSGQRTQLRNDYHMLERTHIPRRPSFFVSNFFFFFFFCITVQSRGMHLWMGNQVNRAEEWQWQAAAAGYSKHQPGPDTINETVYQCNVSELFLSDPCAQAVQLLGRYVIIRHQHHHQLIKILSLLLLFLEILELNKQTFV